jgi:hypothetical protein
MVSPVTADRDALPRPLRWAVWLLMAEAVALGLLAAFLVYEDVTAAATDLVAALVVTAFAIAGAAALWLLGVALARRRAAARGPAIVLQLMLLPIGYYMIQAGLAWSGIVLIAVGLLVTGLLVTPATNRALGVG